MVDFFAGFSRSHTNFEAVLYIEYLQMARAGLLALEYVHIPHEVLYHC
jgi:hypothetical protein